MIEVAVHTPQYVCFEKETGAIFSIGPGINENYDHIEISNEQADLFKTHKENLVNWQVVYNKRLKIFELKKTIIEEENNFLITELKKPLDEYHDIEFVVDKIQKKCYIKTLEMPNNVSGDISFNITKKGDPHFLIKTIKFTPGSDDKISFDYDQPISVYTNEKFAECVLREVQ
jgi:hypothetical protein